MRVLGIFDFALKRDIPAKITSADLKYSKLSQVHHCIPSWPPSRHPQVYRAGAWVEISEPGMRASLPLSFRGKSMPLIGFKYPPRWKKNPFVSLLWPEVLSVSSMTLKKLARSKKVVGSIPYPSVSIRSQQPPARSRAQNRNQTLPHTDTTSICLRRRPHPKNE